VCRLVVVVVVEENECVCNGNAINTTCIRRKAKRALPICCLTHLIFIMNALYIVHCYRIYLMLDVGCLMFDDQ